MLAGMVLAGLAFFSGCQKKPPAAPPEPQVQQASGQEQAEVKTVTAEQTTCPVMGGAIDKTLFVEYKGKKVYFCCKGCPETFLANPEKYLAKLPQFQN
jgi:YHS domain-containing protein